MMAHSPSHLLMVPRILRESDSILSNFAGSLVIEVLLGP